jgi:hypothetical protein
MNHAKLPSVNDAQLPVIDTARLPETYERAKTALSACSSIDECKSWADKAAALASYARQSKDDSMRKMAERIQARAIRRAGELLKQIDKSNKHQIHGSGNLTRAQAASDAGMSVRQQHTAQNVASVPESDFTNQVESDNPPSVSNLADQGKKRQLVDLEGRDPKEFNKAMHFVGMFDQYLRKTQSQDIDDLTQVLTPQERERLRSIIHNIDLFHDKVITRI